jgi:hypothetical protein
VDASFLSPRRDLVGGGRRATSWRLYPKRPHGLFFFFFFFSLVDVVVITFSISPFITSVVLFFFSFRVLLGRVP